MLRWKDESKQVMLVTLKADPSIRALANEACLIPDACNLCGLAQRFAEVVPLLLHHDQNKVGTDWANQNPIALAWLDRFASLVHYAQDFDTPAHRLVSDLRDGKDVEFEVVPSDCSWRDNPHVIVRPTPASAVEKAWRVTYRVCSTDDDQIHFGTAHVMAPTESEAGKKAVAWANDNDPSCDERIDCCVEVLRVEPTKKGDHDEQDDRER